MKQRTDRPGTIFYLLVFIFYLIQRLVPTVNRCINGTIFDFLFKTLICQTTIKPRKRINKR